MGYKSDTESNNTKDTIPPIKVSGTQQAVEVVMDLTREASQSDGAESAPAPTPQTLGTDKSKYLGSNSPSQLGTNIPRHVGTNTSGHSRAEISSQLGIGGHSQLGTDSSNSPSLLGTNNGPKCSGTNINQNSGTDRPHSAHLHRMYGRVLRLIGDDYLCSTCGKTLQVIGDELSTEYAIRKALSCNDLEKLNSNR